MLLGQNSKIGFVSGPNTRGKALGTTEGIWMWGAPIYVKDRDMYIILLDFESLNQPLNGAASTQSYDCKLFALAMVLSSVICFNSKYKLDEKAIEQFSHLIDMPRFLKIRQPPASGLEALQQNDDV